MRKTAVFLLLGLVLARLSQLNLRFTNIQPLPCSKLRILLGVGPGKRV
jgi:hypothetical protein